MKLTPAQLGGRLDRPDPAIRFYLFHGADESGALAHAERLARAMGENVEKIDFENKALRDRPGILADEAASLSLFGDKRLLRIIGAEDSATEAVQLLLSAEQCINPVVAIGPALKGSSKLVKLAVANPAAISVGCYLPEGQGAVQIAVSIGQDAGLRIGRDVAHRIVQASGADRAIMAREIEKLALYLDASPQSPREADVAAFEAIGAQMEDNGMTDAVNAIVEGNVVQAGALLGELADGTGNIGVPLLRMLVRRLMALAEIRAQMDAGVPESTLLERVFFKERNATARALRNWNAAQLSRAIERVRVAERALTSSGSAGDVLADAECLTIARVAARGR